MEFRGNVRRLLGNEHADVKAIDKLYDELDEDHSGSIDAAEVKLALKKLQEAAVHAVDDSASIREKAAVYRARAAEAQKVVDVTKEAEAAVDELAKENVSAALRRAALEAWRKHDRESPMHAGIRSPPPASTRLAACT